MYRIEVSVSCIRSCDYSWACWSLWVDLCCCCWPHSFFIRRPSTSLISHIRSCPNPLDCLHKPYCLSFVFFFVCYVCKTKFLNHTVIDDYCLMDWLTNLLIYWLIDWLIDWVSVWSIDLSDCVFVACSKDERRRQLVAERDEVASRAKRRSLGNIRYI